MFCKSQYMNVCLREWLALMASDRLPYDRPNVYRCIIRMRSVLARSQRVDAHVFLCWRRWRDIVWTYNASIFNEWMNDRLWTFVQRLLYQERVDVSQVLRADPKKVCLLLAWLFDGLKIMVEWHRSRNFSEGHNTVMKWTLQQQQHREARAFIWSSDNGMLVFVVFAEKGAHTHIYHHNRKPLNISADNCVYVHKSTPYLWTTNSQHRTTLLSS